MSSLNNIVNVHIWIDLSNKINVPDFIVRFSLVSSQNRNIIHENTLYIPMNVWTKFKILGLSTKEKSRRQ